MTPDRCPTCDRARCVAHANRLGARALESPEPEPRPCRCPVDWQARTHRAEVLLADAKRAIESGRERYAEQVRRTKEAQSRATDQRQELARLNALVASLRASAAVSDARIEHDGWCRSCAEDGCAECPRCPRPAPDCVPAR